MLLKIIGPACAANHGRMGQDRARATRLLRIARAVAPLATPDSVPMPPSAETIKASNFLRQIVERDLAQGTYSGRHFAGTPGDATHHASGPRDPARIRTRFPPEPTATCTSATRRAYA